MTMWKPMLLVGGLGLSACTGMVVPDFRDLDPAPATTTAVAPPPPPPPPEVRVVSAIEEQGCVLRAENRNAVQLAANLTLPELQATMTRLSDLGRVEATGDGGLRVITDRCTA